MIGDKTLVTPVIVVIIDSWNLREQQVVHAVLVHVHVHGRLYGKQWQLVIRHSSSQVLTSLTDDFASERQQRQNVELGFCRCSLNKLRALKPVR